ncbi:molybdenum cofactor sulfurase-like protein [Amazona aestiva]|uniref:Molybdenum cofactor sulfurase-like protein n=1 Tax=Amazona aestiva TaxID=12930 RepID=A0A0Q3MJL1_AMAAE|nr:molybdenum cofactor sulfurase-like protein [Amazona aestiva]
MPKLLRSFEEFLGPKQGKSCLAEQECLGITYLDHAGSALFPESLLKAFTDDLRNNVYGNPHSQNISSKLTYDTIEHVRYR